MATREQLERDLWTTEAALSNLMDTISQLTTSELMGHFNGNCRLVAAEIQRRVSVLPNTIIIERDNNVLRPDGIIGTCVSRESALFYVGNLLKYQFPGAVVIDQTPEANELAMREVA